MIKQMKDIVIALPTKNEELSIRDMIQRIRENGFELFVIDSHSSDDTCRIAAELNVPVYQRDEYGEGYGCGIQKALDIADQAGFEFLGIIDCDSTYSPENLIRLAEHIPEADLVVGARPMLKIDFWHRIANLIHIYFARILFRRKVMDINSGMRLLRIDLFKGNLSARHMGMVAQMTSFALRNKLKFEEVPIDYGERRGESKIFMWDGLFILYRIFSERFKARVK